MRIVFLPAGTFSCLFFAGSILFGAQANVLTQHNDNGRTGLNTNETILTPTNVNLYGFGKIFSQFVDGPVYAQPLYVSGVSVPNKGTHNMVFVATMHDSVYGFDADNYTAPLWRTSFINPAAGITAASTLDAVDQPGQDCRTFVGEIGIVGTPVIDAASGTLYVVARTRESPGPSVVHIQRLHALDIATGNERSNSPVVIDSMVSGTGDGNVGNVIHFDPKRTIQRPGLLLVGGVVYLSWCSYCDLDPYHGWIIGYDAQTLRQVGVFNASPNARRGGIWMGGAGLAAAADGSIYAVTGNGTFDTGGNPQNLGDSFLKLTQSATLNLADYFTPFDQANMDSGDEDLGSGGVMVLPDVGNAGHPNLVVGGGKLGKFYLIDRDNMGHFNPANDSQIVQSVALYTAQPSPPHFFGLPAFFKNRLYVQGIGEGLKAFAFTNGLINSAPISQAAETFGFRGDTPSISANGTTNGIVWQLTPGNTLVAALRAYDSEDLSRKLYDSGVSTQAGRSDQVSYVKFVVPTIANGKVYVGTTNSLAVFGLRSIFWSVTRQSAPDSIHLVFSAPLGMSNVVQSSSDLIHWTTLGPGTPAGTGTNTFDDPRLSGPVAKFYRICQQ
jgi:hypothetical protein